MLLLSYFLNLKLPLPHPRFIKTPLYPKTTLFICQLLSVGFPDRWAEISDCLPNPHMAQGFVMLPIWISHSGVEHLPTG